MSEITEQDVIDAIRRTHLKANIDRFERDPEAVIHWDLAWVDPGGTVFGPGPYVKVPITCPQWSGDEETVWRVYPPARLRRRLQQLWSHL